MIQMHEDIAKALTSLREASDNLARFYNQANEEKGDDVDAYTKSFDRFTQGYSIAYKAILEMVNQELTTQMILI